MKYKAKILDDLGKEEFIGSGKKEGWMDRKRQLL